MMLTKLNIDTTVLQKNIIYEDDPNKVFYLMGSSYGVTNEHHLIFLAEDGEKRIYTIKKTYPYFYVRNSSRLEVEEVINNANMMKRVKKIESVKLKDSITREDEIMTKVTVKKPTYVSDSRHADQAVSFLFDENLTYENHKSYYHTVLNENGFTMGMPYTFKDSKPIPVEFDWDEIMSLYKKYDVIREIEDMDIAKMLMSVLHAPMPNHANMAFAYDIEIQADYGESVSPKYGEIPIASIAVTNPEKTVVFVLSNKILKNKVPRGAKKFLDGSFELVEFDSERKLLIECLTYCNNLPQKLAVSYNGDGFDIPYIYRRLQVHNLDKRFGIVGYEMNTQKYGADSWKKSYYKKWRGKFLIDLYAYFSNGNVKAGAYNSRYENNKLDTVSNVVLGQNKYKYEGTISLLCMEELAFYNAKDTQLTFDLFRHNNNFPGFILFFIMRIGNLSIENANRQGVTNWWAGLMYRLFNSLNSVAPNHSQLVRVTDEVLKGGIVLDAVPGVYYDVDLYDFSSLYPTTQIKNNICFSTVECNHPECKENSIQLPERSTYICTKNRGYMPIILSFLRNARVKFWKQEGKTGNFFYVNLAQFAKIFMNSGYGVLDNLGFPFAHKIASQIVTSTARDYLMKLVSEVKKQGGQSIYGDSVSEHESIVFRFMDGIYTMKISNMWSFFAEKYFEVALYGEKERMLLVGVEIWNGENNWVKCNAIIRHFTWKSIYRVSNGHSTADITEDHSLINTQGEEFSPRDLAKVGSYNTIVSYKFPVASDNITADFKDVLFFLFSMTGTAAPSYTIYTSQRSLMLQFHPRYAKQALKIFNYISPILKKFNSTYKIYKSKRGKTIIKFSKNIDDLWKAIRANCYIEEEKVKPFSRVFDITNLEIQHLLYEFIKSYYYNKSRNGYPRWIVPMGAEFTLFSAYAEKFEPKKYIYIPSAYGGNSIHVKYWKYVKRKQTVQVLSKLRSSLNMVYDLDTENSQFVASNLLCHNTDSVFVINIPINMEDYFSEKVGIEIENEGKILEMILYSKKNYIKIMKKDRIIKGMTGKKKNNSKLVRKYFRKAVDGIKVGMSISEIQDMVGNIMNECETRIREGKFSIDEIAVTQSLSRDVSDYKSNTPLVQAVNAMKEYLETEKNQIANIGGMGSIMDFVKTRGSYKPTSIVNPSEIDTDYYIKQMYSVFNQLTIPLGISAERLVESKTYITLDKFL